MELTTIFLWEKLYTIPDQNLFNIKYTKINYIRMEKANLIR